MRAIATLLPALALAAGLALAVPAAAQKLAPSGGSSGVWNFSDTDATMNEAIAEAQATLPLFLEQVLDAEGRGRMGLLKVSFRTFPEDVGDEIIWVNSFRRLQDGSFTGFLDDEPLYLGDWRQGTEVQFPASAIQDWSLQAPDGRLWGNYTTRVIAALPGNLQMQGFLRPEPLPPGWR